MREIQGANYVSRISIEEKEEGSDIPSRVSFGMTRNGFLTISVEGEMVVLSPSQWRMMLAFVDGARGSILVHRQHSVDRTSKS